MTCARLGVILAVLACSSSALADDYRVGPYEKYQTLEAAVTGAGQDGSARILLPAGDFDVSLDLSGKYMTIRGMGAGLTRLRAVSGNQVIGLVQGSVTLESLTIDGMGFARSVSTEQATVTLKHVVVRGGLPQDGASGGSVRCRSGSVYAEDVVFEGPAGPSGVGSGGHLHLDGCSTELNDVTASGGEALNGGAINMVDGVLYLRGVTLMDNRASGIGGAIRAQRGQIYARDLVVSGSEAPQGAHLIMQQGSGFYGRNLSFESAVPGASSMVEVESGYVSVTDSSFRGEGDVILGGVNYAYNVYSVRNRFCSTDGDSQVRVTSNSFAGFTNNLVVGAAPSPDARPLLVVGGLYGQQNVLANNTVVSDPSGERQLMALIGYGWGGYDMFIDNNLLVGGGSASGPLIAAESGYAGPSCCFDHNAIVASASAEENTWPATTAGKANQFFDASVMTNWQADPCELDSYAWPQVGMEDLGLPYVTLSGVTGQERQYSWVARLDGEFNLSLLSGAAKDPDGSAVGIGVLAGPNALAADAADADGDGVPDSIDCASSDPEVGQGLPDYCDGVDNNCNGSVDEDAARSFYADVDGDGFGDVGGVGLTDCAPSAGYTAKAGDCDDSLASISPTSDEVCDGIDNNCDGIVDGPGVDGNYEDRDGDGFGDWSTMQSGCAVAPRVGVGGDCDDYDPTVKPVLMYRDNDYDGVAGPNAAGVLVPTLVCGSTSGYSFRTDDCDDANSQRSPLRQEDCDQIDNDCDGEIDEGLTLSTLYRDLDQDGYGGEEVQACYSWGYGDLVNQGGDCDDSSPWVNPKEEETCNGFDDDCDGTVDLQPLNGPRYYADTDGDGLQGVTVFCTNPGPPFVTTPPANEDCDDQDPTTNGQGELYVDQDYDGVPGTLSGVIGCPFANGVDGARYEKDFPYGARFDLVGGDCDDQRGWIYPGAAEYCDSVDNDCDGTIDNILPPEKEGDASYGNEYCVDLDGDQAGDPTKPAVYACEKPTGYAYNCDDCDDQNPYQAAPYAFRDLDGDGFGDAANGSYYVQRCEPLDEGYVLNDGDCDDGDAAIGEGTKYYIDFDGDGFGNPALLLDESCGAGGAPQGAPWSTDGRDCNDLDASSKPGAPERCDGQDNDCDGLVDETYARLTWYEDIDNDGYGGAVAGNYCATWNPGGGYVTLAGDCDDEDVGLTGRTWYRDADDDGHGDALVVIGACGDEAPFGYVDVGDDCDDTNPNLRPGKPEICDGIDQDCDGQIDEGQVLVATYADLDGDGFGNTLDLLAACALSPGRVFKGGDCDDGSALVYPGAPEVCGDGLDQDCDAGRTDLACVSTTDADGDGFCPAASCQGGLLPGDCNDLDAVINPFAIEVCDGVDQDCDGLVDDGLSHDEDRDGHTSDGSCEGSGLDCNDFVAAIKPGATELCNGMDDNCDGSIDEGLRLDADGDGSFAVSACVSLSQADCDDNNPNIGRGLPEVSGNSIDDDCDGLIDEDTLRVDNDGDGYCASLSGCDDGSLSGDCNDSDASRSPNAIEVPNGIDDNCDGLVDNYFAGDLDGDGYCAATSCNAGLLPGDCNDFDAEVNPASVERCNGRDDNCDGRVPADEYDLDFDGWRVCDGDCNDNNVRMRPYLAEDCSDGLDNDCDGTVDQNSDIDVDGVTTCQGDCRDDDALVLPGQPEECNLLDDDCDGQADEGYDLDGDGAVACSVCSPDPTRCDCDDLNALVKPGLPEICDDGFDNDCDGSIDVSNDADNDGWETCDGDCWDDNARVNPGFPELCNGIDDDCDGLVDEDFDVDGDGFVGVCGNDCDDEDPLVNPAQLERCNGVDDDCDGIIPADEVDGDQDGVLACEECDDSDARVWASCDSCRDADGDGALIGCDDNLGAPLDCDDGNAARSPAFAEVCGSGVDEDCDGLVDWDDEDCALAEAVPRRWFCGTASLPGGMSPLLLALMMLGMRRRAKRDAA